MMYCIIFQDNTVAIAQFFSNIDAALDKYLSDKGLQRSDVTIEPCDMAELPDKYFRDAWIHDGTQLNIDMAKACDIHMNAIREARDEKLKELDVETLKGNDVQAQKQALRDLPTTFDLSSAETPEELKALWPEGL